MDRLHATKNASVAIKCLFTIHVVLTTSSLSTLLQAGGIPSTCRNSAMDPTRRPGSSRRFENPRSIPLRRWRRGREGGSNSREAERRFANRGRNSGRFRPIGVRCSKFSSIAEERFFLRGGEDFRLVKREILVRVAEFQDGKLQSLSFGELTRLVVECRRLKGCRERLSLLFVNGKRNDALWEMVAETVNEIIEAVMEKDEQRLCRRCQ
ncbi:unnamed protein product [Linum trigynum]|uniref:Uncharacterized protein n=1 Tax=Linum trigynum TaxID=586398 RepID=A0AAV2GPC2_9ROSI